MSFAATTPREVQRVELGMMEDGFVRGEEIEIVAESVPVDIDVKITGPDSVTFTLRHPMEGVFTDLSTIHVFKSDAQFDLRLHLDPASGYTFHKNAILWVDPPQKGYSADPFGKDPIEHSDPWTAVIPNTTGPKGSPRLETPFALVLENSTLFSSRTVVIDPTIVDEPNT